jgi:hypothetical protein
MGIARSQAELDKVIGHARTVAGVRRVTPFVRLLAAMPPQRDVNGPGPGQEEEPPPPPEEDEDEAAPPQPAQSGPAYSAPQPRGTIKSEPLP